mmetsp:Transcript_172863/g.548877  ORF Transcript_172863/g.548877 Transcript_172863/m.548877 type:complete len:271 (-) Transcript_172863:258-1070(-)
MVPNPVPTATSGRRLLSRAEWIDSNWMFLGMMLCPFVIMGLLELFPGSFRRKFSNALFVGWLVVPVYCFHQIEEHAYDLRKWRYAFVPAFNHGTGSQLFPLCDEISHLTCPLTARMTTYINVVTVWVGFPLTMVVAHLLGGRYQFAGLFNWGTATVNGLMGHILPALLTQEYNPGFVQSLVMVPSGLVLMARYGRRCVALCMLSGVLFHVVSFGLGINLVLRTGCSEVVVAVLCALCSSVQPLLFAKFACADPNAVEQYINKQNRAKKTE